MGTPQTETKKIGIWKTLQLLKRGVELGKQMKVEDFEEVMDMVKEIVLPFVKQLDKPIFPYSNQIKDVPKKHLKKRGILMFESKVIHIWLQRSGSWFTKYQDQESSNFIFEEPSSYAITETILYESDRFIGEFREVAKDSIETFPFLKELFLYYILPLNFVTQSFEIIKKAVEKRREQLLEMEEALDFLDKFNQSLDPVTYREKKLSLTEYSIFGDTRHGKSRDTEGYFTLDDLNPFWEVVKKRDNPEKYHLNIFDRKFNSLDNLIRHLMYVNREIKDTPKTCDSAKALFGRTSGRLPFSEEEIAVIKKLVESI